MDTETKLIKAQNWMTINSPFFGTIALNRPFREDTTCPTAYTNGKWIGYNPEYIDSLDPDELRGLLAEEYLHDALGHSARRGDRDPKEWNIAADYTIMPILVRAGFKITDECLYDPGYDGMSAEEIYSIRQSQKKEQKQDKQQQDSTENGTGKEKSDGVGDNTPTDPGSIGEVRDLVGDKGQSASQDEITQWELGNQVLLQQALQAGKQAGNLPAGMELAVKELLEPKVRWEEALPRWMTQRCPDDYSWARPNRRYIQQGLYMPRLDSEHLGTIVVFMDTSGSTISEQTLLATELQSLLQTFSVELLVVYVDREVQGWETVNADDVPVNLHPKGGGGTDYKPGFEWLLEQRLDPIGVIYLTDGECSSFPEDPNVEVLWLLTSEPKYMKWNPPFGETIKME